MSTHITVPEQGDRILYRHGRGDLPHGTPAVVPGVVYEARPDEVVVLAHAPRRPGPGATRQIPLVEEMRRLDELEQRARAAYVHSLGQVRS